MIASLLRPAFPALAALCLVLVPGHAAEVPQALGTGRHLLVDPAFLREAKDVSLQVISPVKRGRVLEARDPRRTHIGKYGTVLEADGVFHMWYMAHTSAAPDGAAESSGRTYVCYAQSRDGVTWTKPELGLAAPFPGAEPNIVVGWGAGGFAGNMEDSGNVFLDPNAPPAERFKLGVREVVTSKEPGKFGLHLLASPDGIHWKMRQRDVLNYRSALPHLDTENVIFWDPARRTYRAYARYNFRPSEGGRSRAVAYGESPRLDAFPLVDDMKVLVASDDLDPRIFDPTRKHEVPALDYYTSAALRYPWAEEAYFMFPSVYFHFTRGLGGAFAQQAPANAGVNDIRFAASRDGVDWQRFDRRAFVRLGRNGEWDSREIYLLQGVLPDGLAGLHLYYFGSDRTHGWGRNERNRQLISAAGLGPDLDTSGVGMLELRRDGFVAARAGYAGGEFTTPVVTFSGDELVLNIDTSAAGDARVEIRDADGAPIAGFSLAECERIYSTNQISRRVTWSGGARLSTLAGRPVRLRFVMRDADLYALQFRAAEASVPAKIP